MDTASVEFFLLVLEEAPQGGRLAVRTAEWGWPLVQLLHRRTNPNVTLHWVDDRSTAPAPFEEPVGTSPVWLHHWAWEAAEPSWRTGQYRQGVLDAATTVEERTRRKLGSHDTGAKLYQEAFGMEDPTPDQPRLRFPGVSKTSAPQEWRNRHQGARRIGAAVTATIRNWAAHTTLPLDAQLGMEYLAVVSLLGRWVEEAEVRVHHPPAAEAVAQAVKERDTARAALERANQKLRQAASEARREGRTLAQLAGIIGVSAQAVHKSGAPP